MPVLRHNPDDSWSDKAGGNTPSLRHGMFQCRRIYQCLLLPRRCCQHLHGPSIFDQHHNIYNDYSLHIHSGCDPVNNIYHDHECNNDLGYHQHVYVDFDDMSDPLPWDRYLL